MLLAMLVVVVMVVVSRRGKYLVSKRDDVYPEGGSVSVLGRATDGVQQRHKQFMIKL